MTVLKDHNYELLICPSNTSVSSLSLPYHTEGLSIIFCSALQFFAFIYFMFVFTCPYVHTNACTRTHMLTCTSCRDHKTIYWSCLFPSTMWLLGVPPGSWSLAGSTLASLAILSALQPLGNFFPLHPKSTFPSCLTNQSQSHQKAYNFAKLFIQVLQLGLVRRSVLKLSDFTSPNAFSLIPPQAMMGIVKNSNYGLI